MNGSPLSLPQLRVMRKQTAQAVAGDPTAQHLLGNRYSDGNGVTKDAAAASAWWTKAAVQGNVRAQHNLGMAFERNKDYSNAMKFYRLAAEQGFSRSQSALGGMYFGGRGTAIDLREAEKWFRLSVAQGDSTGQVSLGCLYGNRKEFGPAKKLFEDAAAQGNHNGEYFLGLMYTRGEGVTKDPLKATEWFEKAAAGGHELAKKELAQLKGK